MTLVFRCVLIIASLLTLFFMLRRIRQSKVQIEDAIFWIIFAFVLFVISVFPGIAEWMTGLLGIASTVNFVFLFVIFVLLMKLFLMTIKVSQMETKLRELTQMIAIRDAERGPVLNGDEHQQEKSAD